MAKPLTHPERLKRRKDMAAYVKDGKSVTQAAQRFKVTTITIESACRENRVPFARFNSGKSDTLLRIVAKLCEGHDAMVRIAHETYVPREYVSQVVKRCVALDVPINKRYR